MEATCKRLLVFFETLFQILDTCWEHVVVKRTSVPLDAHKGNTTARASSAKVVRPDISPYYLGTSPAQHPEDPRPIQPGLANTLMGKCHCATIFLLDTETVPKISKIFNHCEVMWSVSMSNWLTNHFSYTRY